MFRPSDLLASALQYGYRKAAWWGAIKPGTAAARRFGSFGAGSIVGFPQTTIYNERYIRIGRDVRVGPHVSLSVGMAPGQVPVSDPVLVIGDRVMLGRNSAVVAHLSIEIGDDVFTGHSVYITDQNHGYEDIALPIGLQVQPEQRVRIGAGSWLGHGTVVLPGATIGRHVTVAAGSVVTGDLPDFSVAVGAPARVVRRYVEGDGWVKVERGSTGAMSEADKTPGAEHGADRTANEAAAAERQAAEGGPETGTSPEAAEQYQDQAEAGAAQGGKGRVE